MTDEENRCSVCASRLSVGLELQMLTVGEYTIYPLNYDGDFWIRHQSGEVAGRRDVFTALHNDAQRINQARR